MIRDIIIFILGIIGGSAYMLGRTIKYDGVMNVNTSDPEKDKYLLLFNIPIESIGKKRYLFLKVTHNEESRK